MSAFQRNPASESWNCPGLAVSALAQSPSAAFRALRTDLYSTAARSLKTLYFLKSFRGRHYPILHCQFGPNGLIGAFLKDAGFAEVVVVSFHGSDINSYPGKHGSGVYKGLYERADLITAGTEFARRKLISNGCPERKIRFLPVGFRTEELAPPRAGERSPRLILSVGRLHELKGHSYSIEAFAKAHRVVSRMPSTLSWETDPRGERCRHSRGRWEWSILSDFWVRNLTLKLPLSTGGRLFWSCPACGCRMEPRKTREP